MFGTIGDRDPGLVLKLGRHDAVANLVTVADVVGVEDLGRGGVTAAVALAHFGIDVHLHAASLARLRESRIAMARSRTEEFDGTSASGREARRFVSSVLNDWNTDAGVDGALLCIGELAANAVLHGRGPFRVRVSEVDDRVRVEVLDRRPGDVPIAVPVGGAAGAIVVNSTTGRGLQLVAAVATRWGVSTTSSEKSVWAEVAADAPDEPTDPVVDLHAVGEPATTTAQQRTVALLSVPVRHAVASGMQVDELVREFQLGLFDAAVTDDERSRFYDLLDRSAPARLAGRRAALDASAAGDDRFDLDLAINEESFGAVLAFRELLEAVPTRQPTTSATAPADVVAFRDWIDREVTSQLTGNPPVPCPLAS